MYKNDIKLFIRQHPKEGYEDGETFIGEEIQGAAEVTWFVQPRVEKTEGKLYGSPQIPHVGEWRGRF